MINKSTLIVLFAALFLACNIYAAEIEVLEDVEVYGIYEAYECNIDKVYITGSGRSTDRRGGKLRVTITNEDVEVKSDIGNVDSGSLRLIVKTEVEIIAISESMQFTYGVKSHKFSFATGNGQSKFRGGVGHIGEQVMTSGTCVDN